MRRFVTVEDAGGTWSVFDAVFGLPADVEGRLATGLPREEAIRAAAKANARILGWRPTIGAVPLPSGDAAGQVAA
jgi:hypothetical protein